METGRGKWTCPDTWLLFLLAVKKKGPPWGGHREWHRDATARFLFFSFSNFSFLKLFRDELFVFLIKNNHLKYIGRVCKLYFKARVYVYIYIYFFIRWEEKYFVCLFEKRCSISEKSFRLPSQRLIFRHNFPPSPLSRALFSHCPHFCL